ncbi:MAG TPA: hypothetical protein VHB45_12225 [Alloacidobacterium sp.]|nr:hypothetical protein [Alloacidobacterium sp.]
MSEIQVYAAPFPSPLAKLLEQAQSLSYMYLGGPSQDVTIRG